MSPTSANPAATISGASDVSTHSTLRLRRRRTDPHPVPAQADRSPDPRQPARRPATDGRCPTRDRRRLRHRRPARADRAARPRPTARTRPGDDDAAAGRRARRQHAVRAEPGAGAQRAGLPARVHGDHRRAQPDDPVQGEGPGPRRHPYLAAHLPGADGGRHPAVSARVGARRRRPAAAPGADARPRRPLQPRLRPGVRGARDRGADDGRAGDGPRRPRPQDGQVARGRLRHRLPARPSGGRPPEGAARRDGLRHRGRALCDAPPTSRA